MRILIAVLLLAALAGCYNLPAREPMEVKIEVPVKCEAKTPAPQQFAVDLLPIGSDIWEQMQALREERKQRRVYEQTLVETLESCTKPKTEKSP